MLIGRTITMPAIMIVDDAAFMRMMIRDNLKKEGFSEFIEAGNGEEAVELYRENHPGLVLLDITMPVKDGLTALKEIRDPQNGDPDAKVVMCSAMGQENMVIEAVRLGALDFIVKPFKPERLVQTVKNILG
jgi:two-component system chemotaxis response regulator CheY